MERRLRERWVSAGLGECWGLSEEGGSESGVSEFKSSHWEFPSSPVARTRRFPSQGPTFDPRKFTEGDNKRWALGVNGQGDRTCLHVRGLDTLSTPAGRPSWLGAGGRKTARITAFTERRVTVDEVTSMGVTSGMHLPELPFSNVGWPRPQKRR